MKTEKRDSEKVLALISQAEKMMKGEAQKIIQIQNQFSRKIQPYTEVLQSFSQWATESINNFENRYEEYEGQYGDDFRGLFSRWLIFAKKEGYHVPVDFDEFMSWYLAIKHGNMTIGQFMREKPNLSRMDLSEFHAYQKKQLEIELLDTTENEKAEIKIQIREQFYDQVLNILKTYFEPIQHSALDSLLKNVIPPSTQHLHFNGDASQLCDFFNQLKHEKVMFITKPVSKNLISWICKKFKYINREGFPCEIKAAYASKYIEGERNPADRKRLIKTKYIQGNLEIIEREISLKKSNKK
ncbi:MAG: hypothetical protein IPK94_21005 [Saprospiraceae bacterium]|nr:hypothetical protein [Saprospiraceae bacterium]